MVKHELWLKTKFGAISIEFGTIDELKGNFLKKSDIEAVNALVEGAGMALAEMRSAKPGLECICRFSPGGYVELIRQPDSIVATVGLILFAYDPEGATSEQIARSSGVDNAPAKYFGQKEYKDYFTRYPDGRYGLTYEGRQWVQEKIVGKMWQSLHKKEEKNTGGEEKTPS